MSGQLFLNAACTCGHAVLRIYVQECQISNDKGYRVKKKTKPKDFLLGGGVISFSAKPEIKASNGAFSMSGIGAVYAF